MNEISGKGEACDTTEVGGITDDDTVKAAVSLWKNIHNARRIKTKKLTQAEELPAGVTHLDTGLQNSRYMLRIKKRGKITIEVSTGSGRTVCETKMLV